MTIALTDDEVIQILAQRLQIPDDDFLESRDSLAPIFESLTRAEWLEVHAKLLEQYERECEANRSILPGPWLWLLRLTPRVLAFAIAEVLWKAKG